MGGLADEEPHDGVADVSDGGKDPAQNQQGVADQRLEFAAVNNAHILRQNLGADQQDGGKDGGHPFQGGVAINLGRDGADGLLSMRSAGARTFGQDAGGTQEVTLTAQGRMDTRLKVPVAVSANAAPPPPPAPGEEVSADQLLPLQPPLQLLSRRACVIYALE